MSRARYFLRRMRQAGFGGAMRKLTQRLKPFLYWPSYAFGPRVLAYDPDAMRTFGTMVANSIREMAAQDPEYHERALGRADDALSGEITVLGYGRARCPADAGWHRDPFQNHDWPQRYFPLCDFLALDHHCDVKIPWEMSRLQWLVWLGEAAALSEGEAARRCHLAVFATLKNWIVANRVGYGVNWTCGMEVAIRAINIAFATAPLMQNATKAERALVGRCLGEHLSYLTRFPEISDVPGNHYLTGLLGEFVLFFALKGAGAGQTKSALTRFADEAGRQFDSDGFHIERATVYHRLCLDMLALARALSKRMDQGDSEKLDAVFVRAGRFAACISSRSGMLPVVGDQDSGFVLWFGEDARQLDLRFCKASEGVATDLYGFLSSLSGLGDRFFPGPPPSAPVGISSGIGFLRGAIFDATITAGPQGLAGRAPHDHDDALQVHAFAAGHALLVDVGCHSYTLDRQIRVQSIVSSGHNVPRLEDGENFNPVTGSVMPTVCGAPIAKATVTKDGSLTAMLTLPGKTRVERRLNTEGGQHGDCLRIEDRWQAQPPQALVSTWYLGPGWSVRQRPATAGEQPPVGTGASTHHRLLLTNRTCPVSEISLDIESDTAIRVGWKECRISPDYGAWTEATAIELVAKASAPGGYALSFSTVGEHLQQIPNLPTRPTQKT